MDSGSTMSMPCKKSGKSRRIWTAREEEVLVAALKDLVANGWKTDNGFRVGYLNKLEDAMKEVFPGANLKGHPHINSKITMWKRYHGSLSSMLRRTGVNFNGATCMIDCENEELWEAIVREDSNAAAMRYKSWPLYEAWTDIFGRDRATGEGAEDVMEAVNDLILEDNLEHVPNVATDYELNQEEDVNLTDDGTSVNQYDKEGGSGKTSSGRKRKQSMDGVDKLYDIVGQLFVSTKDRFSDISRFIGYEYGLGESRKSVFDLLGTIPDLTLDEKLDVAEKLASNADILEMFMGLPQDANARYVGRMLGFGRS